MFTYHQRTGVLEHPQVGKVATGYAGNGEWKNDPASDHVKGHGPIPRGCYTIGAPVESHGGFALVLTPDPTNDMHGRSGFLVHGDSISEPGTASLGCIVVPRLARWAIWGSGDRRLMVVE